MGGARKASRIPWDTRSHLLVKIVSQRAGRSDGRGARALEAAHDDEGRIMQAHNHSNQIGSACVLMSMTAKNDPSFHLQRLLLPSPIFYLSDMSMCVICTV